MLLNKSFIHIMRQFHMNRAVLEIVSITVFCNVTVCVSTEVRTFRKERNDDPISIVHMDHGLVRMWCRVGMLPLSSRIRLLSWNLKLSSSEPMLSIYWLPRVTAQMAGIQVVKIFPAFREQSFNYYIHKNLILVICLVPWLKSTPFRSVAQ